MTRFDLDVIGVGDKLKEIVSDFKCKCEKADYALDQYGLSNNSTSWPNCFTDLKEFSKDWPDMVFVLTEEGRDGCYKYYAKNGEAEFVSGQIGVIYPKPKNFLVSDWSTK